MSQNYFNNSKPLCKSFVSFTLYNIPITYKNSPDLMALVYKSAPLTENPPNVKTMA